MLKKSSFSLVRKTFVIDLVLFVFANIFLKATTKCKLYEPSEILVLITLSSGSAVAQW